MFIVFESIDGGGKGRQREEVMAKLAEKGMNLKGEEFPVHDAFYETVIHPALQGEKSMNSSSWVLSYLLDKTLNADKILPFVGNKENLFIADGYFTTTIAYQSMLMQQVELSKLISYANEFQIPKPDLAVYIDVDPEVAMKWKEKEEGHDEGLDMFEKDIEKQKKLRGIFSQMVDEKIYCDWVKVHGMGSIEEVTQRILEALQKRLVI